MSELEGRTSLSGRIVQILQSAEEPLSRGEVLTQLHADGYEPNGQVVSNTLTRLVKSGRLSRDEGVYEPAELVAAR